MSPMVVPFPPSWEGCRKAGVGIEEAGVVVVVVVVAAAAAADDDDDDDDVSGIERREITG